MQDVNWAEIGTSHIIKFANLHTMTVLVCVDHGTHGEYECAMAWYVVNTYIWYSIEKADKGYMDEEWELERKREGEFKAVLACLKINLCSCLIAFNNWMPLPTFWWCLGSLLFIDEISISECSLSRTKRIGVSIIWTRCIKFPFQTCKEISIYYISWKENVICQFL